MLVSRVLLFDPLKLQVFRRELEDWLSEKTDINDGDFLKDGLAVVFFVGNSFISVLLLKVLKNLSFWEVFIFSYCNPFTEN